MQPRTKLIEARLQRHLSQQQLAERIGTNYVNVSRWERGITRPGPYFRRKLSHLFGKTEEELDLALGSDEVFAGSSPSPTNAALDTAVSPVPGESVPAPSPSSEAIYDPSIPLPPPLHLVGRDDELANLRTQLRSGGSVAMT